MEYTRNDVVEFARDYVGIKFTRSGRDKMKGIDCVGLLTLVGRDLGQEIDDLLHYNFEPNPDAFLNTIRTQSNPASMNAIRPGMIVLLRQSIYPMHCGIMGINESGLTVINANMHARRVVEQPVAEWRNSIIEVRDYKGLID